MGLPSEKGWQQSATTIDDHNHDNPYDEIEIEPNVLVSLNDALANVQIYDDANNNEPTILPFTDIPGILASHPNTHNDESIMDDWGDPYPLEETDEVLTEQELIYAIHQLNFDPISDEEIERTSTDTQPAQINDDDNMELNGFLPSDLSLWNQPVEDLPLLEIQNFRFEDESSLDFMLDDIDHIFDDPHNDNDECPSPVHNIELLPRDFDGDSQMDQENTFYNQPLDMNIKSEDDGDVLKLLDQLDQLFLGSSTTIPEEIVPNEVNDILQSMRFFDPFSDPQKLSQLSEIEGNANFAILQQEKDTPQIDFVANKANIPGDQEGTTTQISAFNDIDCSSLERDAAPSQQTTPKNKSATINGESEPPQSLRTASPTLDSEVTAEIPGMWFDSIDQMYYCQPCNEASRDLKNVRKSETESNADVFALAKPFVDVFMLGTSITADVASLGHTLGTSSGTNTLMGHTERILGCDFSTCGKFIATASQDSTVRIWKTSNGKCVATLAHDKKFELLRVTWASSNWGRSRFHRFYDYLLATGGADGIVRLYGTNNPELDDITSLAILDHATYKHFDPLQAQDPDDKPQIYTLQFIDNWKALAGFEGKRADDNEYTEYTNSFLLTSSDDHIHLWEVDDETISFKENNKILFNDKLNLREVFSLRFSNWKEHFGYGVTLCQVTESGIFKSFNDKPDLEIPVNIPNRNDNDNVYGGMNRNPRNLIFVFDATYCQVNGLLGVALSDGTLRVINGRGVCLSILQLPGGTQSHITSFGWDMTGNHLTSCVATGHSIIWQIQYIREQSVRETLQKTCCAVLSGGHVVGKPLLGAKYIGQHDDELIVTWGVDGRLCLWDSHSQNEIDSPVSVLRDEPDYPIYSVSVIKRKQDDDNSDIITIAVAGGDRPKKGESGIPVYLYHIVISQ